MIRFIIRAAAVIVTIAAAQIAAHAHFVWATVENGQARFALLEDAGGAPDAQFEKYVADLRPLSGGKMLTLGAAKDGARYAALPTGENVVSAESVVGVRERDGETYLLVYHAKGAASLAAAGTVTMAPAELLARRDGETLVVSVRQNGWPVAQSEVWLHTPGNTTPVSARTDGLGEARVTLPTGQSGGFVGVRALVKDARPGEVGGKKYPAVHRWATLTFPNPAAPLAPSADKPFSQILRASYANNHEVVGAAAFNKTLFDGKLTKNQLTVHLEQRALVHNEAHRILTGAAPAQQIPYGAAQKNVLVLLADDLTALGSGVPTEAQAHVLTKAFLREIRESERNGPYFALGVQHVYYGGITNGGRMIGEKIGEMLQFTPTYYAKSDGYREYLAEVNKITDPKARAEMIRGGQAAYRYIIASSNEEVFLAK